MIPLGVDPNEFSPSQQTSPMDPPVVFYAGHLVPAKGVDHLVRAMSEVHRVVPQARLVLAGDGFDRPRLEQMAKDLGIDGCTDFLGSVPFYTMPERFRQCTIFCLPTLAEAFGLSLLQAMSTGKPVVASAVGGIPHFVENGKSGHLVAPSDPQALAQALIDLLTQPELMAQMGQYNRQRVLDHYSWSAVVDQIEALYEKVLHHDP
jgi:glycosyltransferase involved in cell wall biosynthesis